MVSYEGEKRRQAKADKLAIGLLERLSWPPYLLEVFGPPWVFLRQGVICYVNGTYMPFVLMARTALETAVYLSITTDIYGHADYAEKVDLSYADERNWKLILEEAYKRKLLTKKDIRNIEYVRRNGNMVAHWAQKVHYRFKENESNNIKRKAPLKGKEYFTFQATVPSVNLNKFIITETKATLILKKSIDILKSMSDRV